MTPSTSAPKHGANPHSNGETQAWKKGRNSSQSEPNDKPIIPQEECERNSARENSNSTLPGLKDPPIYPLQDDVDQGKHRRSVKMNLKPTLIHQLYASEEFVRALSFEVTTCFTALMTKVYLKTSTPSPRNGDFFNEVDNGVTGVLGLLTRKQISDQLKDYNMNNKRVKFESLLQNVHGETGGGNTTPRLYGRNVVNYTIIKKYMIMYREILVWYMENVQYPPAPEIMCQGFCFYTKCQNGSPHDSKHYVTAMKKFLDGLMAKLSLRLSMSHSYNQFDLDQHFNTCQVLLPLHSPLVFHYLLNYKDMVSNYYNIHFDFDNNKIIYHNANMAPESYCFKEAKGELKKFKESEKCENDDEEYDSVASSDDGDSAKTGEDSIGLNPVANSRNNSETKGDKSNEPGDTEKSSLAIRGLPEMEGEIWKTSLNVAIILWL
eukprot:jgi/Psemu1/32278/gm1.32278_g